MKYGYDDKGSQPAQTPQSLGASLHQPQQAPPGQQQQRAQVQPLQVPQMQPQVQTQPQQYMYQYPYQQYPYMPMSVPLGMRLYADAQQPQQQAQPQQQMQVVQPSVGSSNAQSPNVQHAQPAGYAAQQQQQPPQQTQQAQTPYQGYYQGYYQHQQQQQQQPQSQPQDYSHYYYPQDQYQSAYPMQGYGYQGGAAGSYRQQQYPYMQQQQPIQQQQPSAQAQQAQPQQQPAQQQAPNQQPLEHSPPAPPQDSNRSNAAVASSTSNIANNNIILPKEEPSVHTYNQIGPNVGQFQPPGSRPKITTTMWEDEKTLCYQVEANGISVVRRADNNMINGTKLLNVAKMTRGRRDGILKAEKTRHVVKIGSMHLKGVWIPFDRALIMAEREKIVDILYPLFVKDIHSIIQQGTPTSKVGQYIVNKLDKTNELIQDLSLEDRKSYNDSTTGYYGSTTSAPVNYYGSVLSATGPNSSVSANSGAANGASSGPSVTAPAGTGSNVPPSSSAIKPSNVTSGNNDQSYYTSQYGNQMPQMISNDVKDDRNENDKSKERISNNSNISTTGGGNLENSNVEGHDDDGDQEDEDDEEEDDEDDEDDGEEDDENDADY